TRPDGARGRCARSLRVRRQTPAIGPRASRQARPRDRKHCWHWLCHRRPFGCRRRPGDRQWADGGRIVFISSESAVQIPEEMIHYGMTKTAQLASSRGLAEALARTGITVNSILPGPTKSHGVDGFVETLAKNEGKSFAELEQEFFE